MKYEVRVDDRTFEVEVNGDRVRVGGGQEQAAALTTLRGPLRRLDLAGRSRTYAVQRSGEAWIIHHGGIAWTAEIADERARTLRQLVGKGAVQPREAAVRAPMPGLVLRLEVKEGQAVAAGAGLVVLEAMKMENEIRAPAAGTVRKVLVTQGQAVEKGAPLVELERQG